MRFPLLCYRGPNFNWVRVLLGALRGRAPAIILPCFLLEPYESERVEDLKDIVIVIWSFFVGTRNDANKSPRPPVGFQL